MDINDTGISPRMETEVILTARDIETIYTLLIDRFEHLDMIIRSIPADSQTKAAVEVEREHVETVIKRICN